jgi:signal peptidase I
MQAQQKDFVNPFCDMNDLTHARKCELVEEVLAHFGALRLRVTGRSMLPSIWPGDILCVERCNAQQVSAGEILLFRRSDQLLVHRVVSVAESLEKSALIAQGDALPAADYPVTRSEVLGAVSKILRNGRYLNPSSRLSFFKRLIGVLSWRSNLLALILVRLHSIFSFGHWREGGGREARRTKG